MRADWLKLLAPLPDDATPRRSPVASPGSEGAKPGSPIAGWTNVVFDLSDMPYGTRIVLITLDAEGRAISASDHVYLRDISRLDVKEAMHAHVPMRQESVGGRIEEDGSFRGTHWTVEGMESDEDEPKWTHTPRPPSDTETSALLELVEEVLRR
jgi:hypothetical protein